MVRKMRGADFGHRQLHRIAHALRRLRDVDDPAEAFRIVQEAQRGRQLYKGRDFNDDGVAWSIYSAIRPDSTKANSLAEKLKGPHRWLATRLVRLFPVVGAMYERVKSEHEVVDYLDLLIKLRDLLRGNLDGPPLLSGIVRSHLRRRVPGHRPAAVRDRLLSLRGRRHGRPRARTRGSADGPSSQRRRPSALARAELD